MCRGGAARQLHFLHPFPVLNRRLDALREERLNKAKTEIAERIRGVCTDMSPEDFDTLVTHMAEVQIKYSLRRSSDLFPDGGGVRREQH